MSRGIGKTQKRILEIVNAEPTAWTVADVAKQIEIGPRQCRTAVRSLEGRGLVYTFKKWAGGYKGWDEYGPIMFIRQEARPSPNAVLLRKGDPWPTKPGYVATGKEPVWTVRGGVPVGPSLWVCGPEAWEERKRWHAAFLADVAVVGAS